LLRFLAARADFLLDRAAVAEFVTFFVVFLDAFLAAPALPAAFVAVLLVTLLFEVLFLEGFFTTFFLTGFFLADFFLETFFLTTFFFEAFFFAAFFFEIFFLAAAFFFATLRATFFLLAFFGAAFFFATDFRALEVVFFREGFFLAAICLNPDGDKITAALYIWEPDFKALYQYDVCQSGLILARTRDLTGQPRISGAGRRYRISVRRRVNRLFSPAPSRASGNPPQRWYRCRPGR